MAEQLLSLKKHKTSGEKTRRKEVSKVTIREMDPSLMNNGF